MLSKKRKIFVLIISVLIALTLAFIWGNSCLPKAQSAESSSEAQGIIQTVLDNVFGEDTVYVDEFHIRKLAHFAEFFALGAEFALLIIALNKENYKSYLTLLPIGLFVGAVDESIQVFSDRGAAVLDVLIDFSGYLTAIAVFVIIFALRKSVKSRKK